MDTPTRDNVLPFRDPTSPVRRSMNPESVGLIADCRELALKRITAVLANTLDKIEDELFQLASAATDRSSQGVYLDARSQAHEKRSEIEAAFRMHFVSLFERKVAGTAEQHVSTTDGFGGLSLSLVEDSDLEEKLAVSDIARRLSERCNDELGALSQRMGYLMADPDITDDANPMSPNTIINALKVACDQMTSGYQTKLTVMRLAEQHMSREMLTIYHDINALLVSRKILPQIRPGYRKARTSVVPKPLPATDPFAKPEGLQESGTPTGSAGEIYSTLKQLLAGGSMFDPDMAAGSAAPPTYGVTTGSFAPAPPAAGVTLSAALRAIAEGASRMPTVQLLSALSALQLRSASAMRPFDATDEGRQVPEGEAMSTLRALKSQVICAHSSPLDVMTIDIVAMLFDYIFEDSAIPADVKGLLARLQIPVLKVAILDKSFFSRKQHPTRRLLDRLAEASIGFHGASQANAPLFKKIAAIVDHIHVEFETDVQLFADSLADLESFLAEQEKDSAEFVEKSARIVFEQERREMARMIAQDEIDRRCAAADLPSTVFALLRGPWTRVLERVYLREGGRQAQFVASLEAADELIWSVLPKQGAVERRRLVGLLPGLLEQLHSGMEVAAVETEDRVRFFASLVDCHAAAVKAGLRGGSVAELLGASPPNTSTGPLFERLVAEESARTDAARIAARAGFARIHFSEAGVSIQEVMNFDSPAGELAAPVHMTSNEAIPVELRRGSWVEFRQLGDRKVRAKLSWISPHRGVYLFTCPGSDEAFSIAPDVLEQQLKSGQVRRIDEASVVDRAVDNMVHALQGAANR